MKRAPVFYAAFILAVVSLCGAPRGFAQDSTQQETPPQQAPSQPKPAGRDYQPFGDDSNVDSQATPSLNPDTVPLTGVLVPGVGSQEMRHSYWVPGFQYGNLARSSTLSQPGVSDWNSTSFVAGDLSLLETWSRSQLTVDYSGGGVFSTDKSQGNSFFHQLGILQAFNWQRWQLSFIDQFSYLPQTQFGFGGSSSLSSPGVGGSLAPSFPGLQTSYQPSQSIFAALGSRYSNSITTQFAYEVSQRGSVTLSGSYGLLRFVEAGNIDSNQALFSAGYDYRLSKKDTVGLLYRFSEYRYLGDPQAIQDHTIQIAYGRKITGRLALQLFAGPEVTDFRAHTAGLEDRTSVGGGANLTYTLAHTGLSAGYNHGVSGGSGVLTGSNTDTVTGSIIHQLSRVWHSDISFGYSRNSSLTNANVVLVSPTFDSWFAGAGVDRPIGRTANLSVGYTAYLASTSESGCSAATCTSYLQHQVSLSFQWHTRPFVLR